MRKRILIKKLMKEDVEERDLLLGVAEALGLKGFQARVGLDGYEVIVEGEEDVVEDFIEFIGERMAGSSVEVEDYDRRVMDLDMYKRVLYVREHPDEVRERRELEGEG